MRRSIGEPNELVRQPHRSLPVRAFTVGIISLGLGGLGIILPGKFRGMLSEKATIMNVYIINIPYAPYSSEIICRATNHTIYSALIICIPLFIWNNLQVVREFKGGWTDHNTVDWASGIAIKESESCGTSFHNIVFLSKYFSSKYSQIIGGLQLFLAFFVY